MESSLFYLCFLTGTKSQALDMLINLFTIEFHAQPKSLSISDMSSIT